MSSSHSTSVSELCLGRKDNKEVMGTLIAVSLSITLSAWNKKNKKKTHRNREKKSYEIIA